MRVIGVDHVDLRFRDFPQARRFFQETLRLPVLSESNEHVFLLLGDQVLGLHPVGEGEAPSHLDHLALRVEEAKGVTESLRAASVPVARTKEREDSVSWFVNGPEGLTLELIHRPAPVHHNCHGAA